MKKILLITLFGASLVLAGCALQTPTVNQNTNQSTANINQNVNQNVNTNTNTNQPTANTNLNINANQPKEVVIEVNCDAFPDRLSVCSKYKCQFIHPMTGETLQKEITGIVNGKCNYVEQMPNNGKMTCNYTESQRKVAAQYYKDVAAAKSAGTSIHLDLDSGEQKATYTIDGKKVENPLQTFMTDGTCIISGY